MKGLFGRSGVPVHPSPSPLVQLCPGPLSLSDLTVLLQVHDDAGLLACSALSETYVQAAGGRPGPHCGLDLQPGRAAPPPGGLELRPLSHRLLGRLGRHPPIPFCHRSIWTCPYRWTSTHPAFPTHGAPPAPQGRTLSSLMSRYLRSPVCPDTPPSSPTVDSNGADYQPCPQPSPPIPSSPVPLTHNPLVGHFAFLLLCGWQEPVPD